MYTHITFNTYNTSTNYYTLIKNDRVLGHQEMQANSQIYLALLSPRIINQITINKLLLKWKTIKKKVIKGGYDSKNGFHPCRTVIRIVSKKEMRRIGWMEDSKTILLKSKLL